MDHESKLKQQNDECKVLSSSGQPSQKADKQLRAERKRANELEEQLIESKINLGQLDMENDEIMQKMHQKNHQLKAMSTKITSLELAVVKARQDLGEAMNQIHDLSSQLTLLHGQTLTDPSEGEAKKSKSTWSKTVKGAAKFFGATKK